MDQKTIQLFKYTFGEGSGLSVLKHLRTRFFDQPSYTRNDPYHTAYIEGQREVIRYINSVLKQKTEE